MDPTSAPQNSEYVPAPHLVALSCRSAADLVLYYRDFRESLKYVNVAPELVFERLVTNLNIPTETYRPRAENPCHTCNDRLKGGIERLKPIVSKLAITLEKSGGGSNVSALPSYYQLKADLDEARSALSTEVGLTTRERDSKGKLQELSEKLQVELDESSLSLDQLPSELVKSKSGFANQVALTNQETAEKNTLRSSNDRLVENLAEATPALSTQVGLTAQEKDLTKQLQQSNNKLEKDLEEAKLAFSRKTADHDSERHRNEALRSSNAKLQSSIDQANLELAEARLELTKQAAPTTQERDAKGGLQSANDKLTGDLDATKIKLGVQIGLTYNKDREKEDLEFMLCQCKARLAALNTKFPGSLKPAIGTLDTGKLTSHPAEVSKTVIFNWQYPDKITLALGYSSLDISSESYIYMYPYVQSYQGDRCSINIKMRSVTTLHQATCVWLEIPPTHPDFECGRYLATGNLSTVGHNRGPIAFGNRYSNPPNVIVWLSEIAANFPNSGYLRAYAANITSSSFQIHIDGLQDPLGVIYVSWYAHRSSQPGVCSGSIETSSLKRDVDGYLKFKTNLFKDTPRVAVGISGFQIGSSYDVKASVSISDVTTAGMKWGLEGTLKDCPNHIEASYIAME